MDKNEKTQKLLGGRASRAEVYGLFIAAIVLVGGGVGGAIAFTNSDPFPGVTSTAPADTNSTPGATPSTGAVGESSSTSPTNSQSTTGSIDSSSCPYTADELNYYNNIRATKQAAVDQAQSRVDDVHNWIASNTAHLEELLAAPYRPIEVFQWKPDGTPYVWRVDSNEEIAQERQRIIDNQSELVRAEEALRVAIADRDQIPGC